MKNCDKKPKNPQNQNFQTKISDLVTYPLNSTQTTIS
jgi:hypothetical protein